MLARGWQTSTFVAHLLERLHNNYLRCDRSVATRAVPALLGCRMGYSPIVRVFGSAWKLIVAARAAVEELTYDPNGCVRFALKGRRAAYVDLAV